MNLQHVLLFVGLIQVVLSQCPYAYSPDGYIYDLTDLSSNYLWTNKRLNRVQSYKTYQYGTYYTFNISICAPNRYACGYYCAAAPDWSGVCQTWDPNTPGNAKCLGQYEYSSTVGLNNGQGVQIIYNGGDVCGSCNPSGPRSSIITLTCGSSDLDPYTVRWTSVYGAEPQMPPIMYFNGTINCKKYYTPASYSPQPSWGPSGSNPNQHVTIKYYGKGSNCNANDSYMILVNRTASCTPNCQSMGNTFVQTDCNTDLFLPAAQTWIKMTYYGNNYYCETPQYATYTLPDQCSGALSFSYQECDADAVYTYSCPTARCTGCTLSNKMATDLCSYGTQYQCITSNSRQSNVYPNPLF